MARINSIMETMAGWLLAALFAALIGVVALQVLARNILAMPMIWTLDVAQLLFAWCIFVGAGIAFRKGTHYVVDLWPAKGPVTWIPATTSFVAAVVVVCILIRNGIDMADIMSRRKSQTMGISLAWYFAPFPICGVLIGLALLERIERFIRENANR